MTAASYFCIFVLEPKVLLIILTKTEVHFFKQRYVVFSLISVCAGFSVLKIYKYPEFLMIWINNPEVYKYKVLISFLV